ncbi:unnamed protein product [Boreogadus saida]
MKNMEALVRKLVEETMAQQAMCKELVGVLTAGHVGRPAGVAIPCPGSQQATVALSFQAQGEHHGMLLYVIQEVSCALVHTELLKVMSSYNDMWTNDMLETRSYKMLCF